MAFSAPWGNQVSGKDTTGESLGIQSNNQRNEVATFLHLENTGGNALDVSFDSGVSYPIQIPAGEARDFEASLGDGLFIKAAAATTDVQWWARSGSP
jgi:hypothetical protein